MRPILVLLLVCVLNTVSATDYYFSSTSGNDSYSSAQAQNPNTPWQSLSKLNSVFGSLNPGDVVYLKRGDVFYGSINVGKSGSSGAPITISAYGQGAKPIVTGLITLSNWVAVGNGIWETNASLLGATVNNVILNGVAQAMGRYPNADASNKGWLRFESFVGNSSITDNELNSSINWTGAEVVIRKRLSVIDRLPITNHVGGNIWYSATNASYPPADNGYGYFIQNHINTLDQMGEWYYNSSAKKFYMYFGPNNPWSYTVQVPTIENLVDVYQKSNIVFDNLNIQGANALGMWIKEGNNIFVRSCDITYSGVDGLRVFDHGNFRIENSKVANSNNNAINLGNGGCNAAIIRNNVVENTFLFAGMAKNGDGNGFGIYGNSPNALIEYNQVYNTGYSGILFMSDNVTVKNNYVDNFCFVKDDGSGIYTYGTKPYLFNYGRRVIGNIVLNGVGAPAGSPDNSYRAEGIFLDGYTSGVEVRDNTFANCSSYGLFTNSVTNVVVDNNTFYNNHEQLHMIRPYPDGPLRDNNFQNNIFFSKEKGQLVSSLSSVEDDIHAFGVFDNNYYVRPLDNKMMIQNALTTVAGVDMRRNVFDLQRWQRNMNKDWSSRTSPIDIPAYTVHGITSGNLFANGDFNSGLGNFWLWTGNGKGNASWSNGKLDGGCAQIGFSNPTATPANQSLIYQQIGAVSSNKHYKLNFSLIGSNDIVSLDVYLRNTNYPYNRLSEVRQFKISSNRSENEVVFSNPSSASDAVLVFEVNDQNVWYWLDNIQLHEANVTVTRPDDHIRFEYNPTSSSKTVALDATYVDSRGNRYAGSISIAPFGSAVLIRDPNSAPSNPVAKTDQWIDFPGIQSVTLGANPFNLNASASSGLPVSYSIVSGPASVSGGTVVANGVGNVVVEASQGGDNNYNPANPVRQSFSIYQPSAPPTNPGPAPLPPAPTPPAPTAPSAPASTCAGTGSILREEWGNANGINVSDIPLNKSADGIHLITQFETVNSNNMFGARMRGYICAPMSGNYTFWISGNDGVELWLSTDENPGNKRQIGGYVGFTAYHEWNKYAFQQSPAIYLEAGHRYYIEALHKGGRGNNDNHVSVQWQLPNGATESPIPGSRIAPFVPGSQPAPSTPAVASCSGTGGLVREEWGSIDGDNISSINLNRPAHATHMISQFETVNTNSNFGARMRGYVCPPETGNYTFWISGDDGVELWLSTNDDPSNKTRIAGFQGWTNFRDFSKYSTQQSSSVYLVAGQRYYIEALHKGGNGPNHMSVEWQLPNASMEAPIPGNRLSPYWSNNNSGSVRSMNSNQPTEISTATKATLTTYPNPMKTVATVQVNPTATEDATIDLYSVQGTLVKRLFKGRVEAGVAKNVSLTSLGLKNGVYMVRYTTQSQVLSNKVILTK
jgi:hypothetical protein